MIPPLFQRLSPTRSEKVEAFSALTDNFTLVQCYKNWVEIGSKYQPEIHVKIDEVVERVNTQNPPPWWVILLD